MGRLATLECVLDQVVAGASRREVVELRQIISKLCDRVAYLEERCGPSSFPQEKPAARKAKPKNPRNKVARNRKLSKAWTPRANREPRDERGPRQNICQNSGSSDINATALGNRRG